MGAVAVLGGIWEIGFCRAAAAALAQLPDHPDALITQADTIKASWIVEVLTHVTVGTTRAYRGVLDQLRGPEAPDAACCL